MKLLFLQNNLVGHQYVEPYAGGAGVALSLLFEEYASRIHINDLSRSVYAFWYSVLHETEELCNKILTTPVTIEEWLTQRDVQRSEGSSLIDLGFSTFFLNRTNRSGIIEGGVIGGLDQSGPWKIDARYNADSLVGRIKKISRYRNRITLSNKDASDFIQTDLTEMPVNTFVYFDPPYFVKGQGLYENSYNHADHVEIAGLIKAVQLPWIVSYDTVSTILELYEGLEQITYDLSYSARDHYAGKEVMFFSPQVAPPFVDSPAGVPTRKVDNARTAAKTLF